MKYKYHFNVPLIYQTVFVYYGNEGRVPFDKYVNKYFPNHDYEGESDGICFDNHIWLSDKADRNTVLHECVHLLQNFSRRLGAEKEIEFNAYCGAYIIDHVLKIHKERNLDRT